MHIKDGELRAYQDQQTTLSRRAEIESHLSRCTRCQRQAEIVGERSKKINAQLERLSAPAERLVSPGAARLRLESYINEKENTSMSRKSMPRLNRWSMAGLALIALLAISFAFPQVRAIAVDFLGLFRVEQVTVIPFNQTNLRNYTNSAGPRIEQMLSDSTQFEEIGERKQVDTAAEASELAGLQVRLPSELGNPRSLSVEPGGKASFSVDLPRVRTLLAEMGREDIALPDDLDNTTIVAKLPRSVAAQYGDCELNYDQARQEGHDPDDFNRYWNLGCKILVQMPSPTVSAPPGLDIDQIGVAFLQLLGLSAEEAETFSQRIDWASTLVLPIPANASSEEVMVDGVKGILVTEQRAGQYAPISIIWVKDGVLYYYQSRSNQQAALSAVNSLK